MAKQKAFKVKSEADFHEYEIIEFDEENSLEVLQEAVGGLIDLVKISDDLDLWVNDEGLLMGLPRNYFAMKVYTHAYHTQGLIVGDVIFTGGVDEEGNSLGLTDEQIDRLIVMHTAG